MFLSKKIAVSFFAILASVSLLDGQERRFLWDGMSMPNFNGTEVRDSVANERIYSVARPSVDIFAPSKEENRNFAVLIIPGGGYERSAYVVSGVQIARYFNTLGATAFVLNYRLPNSPNLINRAIAPLQDAQQAMKLIRSLASTYNFDENKIGVFGTSAGGHLASMLGTFQIDYSQLGLKSGSLSYKPNFMVLLSPVIMLSGNKIHKGSAVNLLGKDYSQAQADSFSTNNRVTRQTPPTLLFHADDDTSVPCENSIAFYQSMRKAGVPGSLHIFDKGGHKIALTKNALTPDSWKTIMERWLLVNVVND